MRTPVKRLAAVLCIITSLLLFQPLSYTYAADTGGEIKAIQQNKNYTFLQALQGNQIRAVTKEKLLYITTGASGLIILGFDEPSVLRDVTFPEPVSLIGIFGNYIYLPVSNGLYILDITDPINPAEPVKIPVTLDEPPVSITIDSGRMYLAGEKNVFVYSLENPESPLLLTAYCVGDTENEVKIAAAGVLDGTAYIVTDKKVIRMYSFSDINNIAYIGRYDSPEGGCTDAVLIGKYAFIGIQDKDGMEVLDISDIEKPKYIEDLPGVRSIICIEGSKGYAVDDHGNPCVTDLARYIQPSEPEPEPKSEPKSEPDTAEQTPDKNSKIAYITIDDGPSRKITAMNLDTLKKYGVKATFFVLPKSGLDDIYQRIIDEGHVIGNHSYSHDYTYLYGSSAFFKKDVIKAKDFVLNKFGYTTKVFRFPGGAMGLGKRTVRDRADILAGLGYKYFDWDVSAADTDPNLRKYGNEEKIVNLLANNITRNAKGRKKLIILMHDSSDKIYSAKALPKIIEGLKKQGYTFDVLTNY